jgi:hypothetical protein
MVSAKRPECAGDLTTEVEHWLRTERENRELKDRVAAALEEVRTFIAGCQAEVERRKGRLLQTGGFRDETRAMQAALAGIQELFAGGRNISRLFSEIDKYLAAYGIDDTLSRLHTRIALADARDEFMCAFHAAIRGTRLAQLLDILYFMPFACWRSRGPDQRNFRSPSAAEILKVLEELGRRGVDCNGIDPVQLAAIIRVQLAITPRMNYHAMADNKLAELLTDGETLTRYSAKVLPPDAGFCRTAAGILASIRRWSDEFFVAAGAPMPPEIEAEMLQIGFLAADNLKIAGSAKERSTDYLWLLATVVASDRATLKDVLSLPSIKSTRYPAVHERILATKTYLDTVAVLADRILAARWAEAKADLVALTGRSEAIAAKGTHDYEEFTELEQLRERRSDVVKSLIKISESLQLLEPALLDMLTTRAGDAGRTPVDEHLRTLDPATLMNRNRACAEETRLIARQELEKLRVLIGRIATISRTGFATAAAPEGQERPHGAELAPRTSAGGIEIGSLPASGVQALLLDAIRKAAASVRDARSKLEVARKRGFKGDLLHPLNILADKIKKAAEACDRIDGQTVDTALAPAAAATLAALLREILAAHTNVNARVINAKLTPAEKQPLTTLLFAIKTKLSDDLRDIEGLRTELAERPAAPDPGGDPGDDAGPAAEPGAEQQTAAKDAAAAGMAALAAAGNAALKPVKEAMTVLGAAIADPRQDNRAILDAATDLERHVALAREQLTGNAALVGSTAAAAGLAGDEYAAKFDRWQQQLAAVGDETGRLLEATGRIAEIEAAARAAVALEEEVSAAGGPGTALGAGDDEVRRRCGRCAEALDAIGRSVRRTREAREVCGQAARAPWRLLKGAGPYLESRSAALDACEAVLERCHCWIDELRTILSS